jgi:putative addiction module component (TIGR02574 family)
VRFVVGRKAENPVLSLGGASGYIASMSIDQIAAEALRLPAKERAILAESLWESLGDPFKMPAESEDAEALALAKERDRQLDAAEVQPLSHEELMARLRR